MKSGEFLPLFAYGKILYIMKTKILTIILVSSLFYPSFSFAAVGVAPQMPPSVYHAAVFTDGTNFTDQTVFTFEGSYSHYLGLPPTEMKVVAVNGSNEVNLPMSIKEGSSLDYQEGVRYTATSTFSAGSYSWYVFASDGVLSDTTDPQNFAVQNSIVLSNKSETEDDGLQDAKGVADKTKFTFAVEAIGDPDSVNLVITKGSPWDIDSQGLPLVEGKYIITKTFPKGRYDYHFEAFKNSQVVASTTPASFTTGYSSVVFLPGLESSRLYTVNPNCVIIGCENMLWEPNWNEDVRKLYLDPNGASLNPDIYTRDPIDAVYGVLGNIYGGFFDSMNALKTDGTIRDFKPLPYDWRFGFNDIISRGALVSGDNISFNLASSTPFIIQETERLARESDTGKVIIVGHSMGGLVAKALTNKLEEKGEGSAVDKIILVASPQSGAPMAIGALLHGTGQEYGRGFVVSEENARTLGENLPSAYNLLPTMKYFTDVLNRVVTFDETPLTLSFRNTYGNTIDGPSELYQFLLGADGREKPRPSQLSTPNVLNKTIYDRSIAETDALASWVPPSGAEVVQIAGWGVMTVTGITYKERKCHWYETCSTDLDIEPNLAIDGDGTVPVPSALAWGIRRGFIF